MNLKTLRTWHLCLGCFFTPLLLFFAVSGCWQTFDMHRSKKDGSYKAPKALAVLSEVHTEQRFPTGDVRPKSSKLFRYFIFMMTIGFAVTTLLGVLMALKMVRPIVVWLWLLGGLVIPVFILWMGRGFK